MTNSTSKENTPPKKHCGGNCATCACKNKNNTIPEHNSLTKDNDSK